MDLINNYSAVSLALGIGYAAYYWLCIAKVSYSEQQTIMSGRKRADCPAGVSGVTVPLA